MRVQASRHRGVHRGQDEDATLLRRGVHAHRLRRDLALAERAQHAADARVDEIARDPEGGAREDPHQQVVLGGGGEAERTQVPGQDPRQPGRPARDAVELHEGQLEHHADAQSGHAEVVRRETQRGDADHVGQRAGGDGGDRHAQPGRESVAHREHRRDVGAEAVEAGVAQGDLVGVAHHQVQPDREDDVEAGQHHHVDEVLVGQEPRHHRHRRQEGQERPAGYAAGQPLHHAHVGSSRGPPGGTSPGATR